MKLPSKTLEKRLLESYDYIIGVDEVGMGCLAGPVVVCAAMFDKCFFDKHNKNLHWLRDSKALLPHQRERFAEELQKVGDLKFQVSWCHPPTIDKINIYQAARRAMRQAIQKVVSFKLYALSRKELKPYGLNPKTIILVDGKTEIKGLPFDQQAIIKGDRKVFAIACASILAKVYRDKMMAGYAKRFPGYGFEKHQGYGTSFHRAQLAILGPCSIHRFSFAPVAELS